MTTSELTPLRAQYLQIKAQHPDAILFFRLGDFYETFDADAETAARELDLVLTSRPVSKTQRVPMAGVPYHAVEGYIARLIDKGYRVAVADQVGDVNGPGLVAREVTRVVTPGTVLEPALLDEKRPNYLAAVWLEERRAGLAYADLSTGEFATTQLEGDEVVLQLRQELSRLQPRECLIPEAGNWKQAAAPRGERRAGQETGVDPAVYQPPGTHFTPLPAYRFEPDAARRLLLEHFAVSTLAGFGCEGKPAAIAAAGAVLYYLRDTQRGALAQVTGLSTYTTAHTMLLDAATRRNLELTETIRERSGRGSLLGVLDATLTPMGARLLHARVNQPLTDRAELERRLDEVGVLYVDTISRGRVRELLKGLPDLERLTNRVLGGNAGPRDLAGIRRALEAVPRLRALEDLEPLVAGLRPSPELAQLIADALADDPPGTTASTGFIRRGYSAELDGIATATRDAKTWIANLERGERERTGIKSLKVGFNKVFGYYIEITKSNLDAVPPQYIRKQTLVNAERFITPELKEYEALILNAEERQLEIEQRLFRELCQQVSALASTLLATARALARLDVSAALAEVAVRNRYVRPELVDEDVLQIEAGRHPVVELMLRGEPFVPNDLQLGADRRILIITGPNMAGKSLYIRQTALIVLMAQIGSFVPADRARVGIVDRIFTRIGAQDELTAGQSTFMVEMVETANILNHATPRSLLILDEIGRGTSTYDGISIAWAVVEYLHNHPERRAKTLFATHYHELIELAERLPAVCNSSLAVAEEGDRVVFLHRVVPGGADRSYGIHVAQLAGVPRPVTGRAEELLRGLESGEFRPGTEKPEPYQPVLFADEHPIVEDLRQLDVSTLTPLEAINRLYELQKRAQKS